MHLFLKAQLAVLFVQIDDVQVPTLVVNAVNLAENFQCAHSVHLPEIAWFYNLAKLVQVLSSMNANRFLNHLFALHLLLIAHSTVVADFAIVAFAH